LFFGWLRHVGDWKVLSHLLFVIVTADVIITYGTTCAWMHPQSPAALLTSLVRLIAAECPGGATGIISAAMIEILLDINGA
jgi:hypothetical protein